MYTLKIQQDLLRALEKGRAACCAIDTEKNAVWVAPAEGDYALYCIPRTQFYLDTEKLRASTSILKSVKETPKNWARPTQSRRLTEDKTTLVKFETESGKPAYFDTDPLKPFKDIYAEEYRIDEKGNMLHVIDGNGETFAIVLATRVREEA